MKFSPQGLLRPVARPGGFLLFGIVLLLSVVGLVPGAPGAITAEPDGVWRQRVPGGNPLSAGRGDREHLQPEPSARFVR